MSGLISRKAGLRPRGLLFWHKILILLAASILVLTLVIAFATWRALDRAGQKMGEESKQILARQTEKFILNLVRGQGEILDVQLAQARNSAVFGAFILNGQNGPEIDQNLLESVLARVYESTSHCATVFYAAGERVVGVYPMAEDMKMDLSSLPPRAPPLFSYGRLDSGRDGHVVWGLVHVDPFSPNYQLVVDAYALVHRDGGFQGYLGVSVSLTQLIGQFNKQQPVRGGYSFLIDTNRQLVGAPPHARLELTAGKPYRPRGVIDLKKTGNSELDHALDNMILGESTLTEVEIGHEPKYLVSCPLQNINWRLGLVVPVRMATAYSRQLVEVMDTGTWNALQSMLSWAISFLGLALVAGLMLTRYLTASISKISEVTVKMAGGNFKTRLPVATRDELGSLASAINIMANQIGSMIADLNQVNTELKTKNQALNVEIAERKLVVKRLEVSENRYRSLVETIPHGIGEIDAQGLFVYVNQAHIKLLGYSEDELIGKNIDELAPEAGERVKLRRHMENNLKEKPIPTPYLGRVKTKDGRELILQVDWDYRWNDNGKIDGFIAIVTDITEREKALESLRASEAQLRLIIESAPIGIVIVQGNKCVFVNPPLVAMFGYDQASEMLGPSPEAFLSPQYHEDFGRIRNQSQADPKVPFFLEARGVKKNDESFNVSIWLTTIDYQGAPGFLGFLVDTSKEKELMNQLIQSKKMEAIGSLAGGIAHDFNNILMGISGYTSIMEQEIDPVHPHHQKLRIIEQQINSAAELTRQLLGFARGGKYQVKPTDLNLLVKETSDIFGRTKKEINIHLKIQDNIWLVEVDRVQIEQVLLNLLINAWHAMPEGGDLYIESKNVNLNGETTKPFGVDGGLYVCLTITDTGIGMDEETQKRIFEPFFTTKKMGRGTGLGLASVYGIIENHGGAIKVDSQVDSGTTFFIYLPVTDKSMTEVEKTKSELVKGDGTVLLVDDEEIVLMVGREMLQLLGYKVKTAQNGEDAVRIYLENREEISLVILDMIIPGVSGAQIFDRLKEINSEIRVLLSSGYSLGGQAAKILNRGCNGFIQKPFNLRDLSKKLNEIMSRE